MSDSKVVGRKLNVKKTPAKMTVKKPVKKSSTTSVTDGDAKKATATAPTIESIYAAEDSLAGALDMDTHVGEYARMTGLLEELHVAITKCDDKEEHAALKARLAVTLMCVRRHNRLMQYRMQICKQTASEQRATVEAKYLQLQNQLNEVYHMQKEITRCTEFRSGDESIELVPIEEFRAKAPASLTEKTTNEHDLRLARLNWELKERQTLFDEVIERVEERDSIRTEATTAKANLDSILPLIDGLLESTRPLQELLHMPLEREWEQRRLALSLPPDLHCVYHMAMAEEGETTIERGGDGLVSVTLHIAVEQLAGKVHVRLTSRAGVVTVRTSVEHEKSSVVNTFLPCDTLLHNLLEDDDDKMAANGECLYAWASQLAGRASSSSEHMRAVVTAVRRRCAHRLALMQDVANVERHTVIKTTADNAKGGTPRGGKLASRIASCRLVTLHDCREQTWAREAIERLDTFDEEDLYAQIVVERGDSYIKAIVHMPTAYPRRAPFFLLLLHDKTSDTTALDSPLLHQFEWHLNGMCGSSSLFMAQCNALLANADTMFELLHPQAFPANNILPCHGPTRNISFC